MEKTKIQLPLPVLYSDLDFSSFVEDRKPIYISFSEHEFGIFLGNMPDKMGWDEASKFCRELRVDHFSWDLPTPEQLCVVNDNFENINATLRAFGKNEIEKGMYWCDRDYLNKENLKDYEGKLFNLEDLTSRVVLKTAQVSVLPIMNFDPPVLFW